MNKQLNSLRERMNQKKTDSYTHNNFYSDEEIYTILKNIQMAKEIHPDHYFFVNLLIKTAARISELLVLKKSHITDNCVTITGTKGSYDRDIPLSEKDYKELKVYSLSRQEYVFDFSRWTALRIVKKYVPACIFEKLKRPAHSLRHSSAVKFLREVEGDVTLVQQLLGHKQIDNTMRYLRMYRLNEHKEDIKNLWKEEEYKKNKK